MKKFNLMCLGLIAGASLAGCSDDTLLPDDQTEAYVRGFIERYGVPDPDHTFSMASRSSVTVKVSEPTDVQVTAIVGRSRYLFADWKGVSGSQRIDFDLPLDVHDVVLLANGQSYPAKVGETINLDKSQNVGSRSLDDFDMSEFPSGSIKRLETENFTSTLPPYSSTPVFYGEIHPTNQSCSLDWLSYYYNDPNHPYQDPNGGSTNKHYWHGHWFCLPANELRQYVGTTQQFYQSDLFVTERVLNTVPVLVPSIYIHYVRKDLEYEMGIMVSSAATFAESNEAYCIPMFTSKDLPEKNQMLKLVQTASQQENFGENTGTAVVFKDVTEGSNFIFGTRENTWKNDNNAKYPFSDVIAKVKNMYELYTKVDGVRPLPLPIDIADLSSVDPNYQATVVEYNQETAGSEFYESYKKYLLWCSENHLTSEQKEKFDKLYEVKEWLGTRGYLTDADDIPVVTVTDDGNQYQVAFPLAKKAGGYAAIEGDFGDKYYTDLKNDDYVVYTSLGAGVSFPPEMAGNEMVYYVKLADGTIITSADNNGRLKKANVKTIINATNEGNYCDLNYRYCWDLNNDGIYDDIIFTTNATSVAAPQSIDKYTWLLACEDLGSTFDFDFNDLVVAVKYVSNNNSLQEPVEVYPVAAGGVYPIYLMYNEIYTNGEEKVETTSFVGQELHKWLNGAERDANGNLPFINTECADLDKALDKCGEPVKFYYQNAMASDRFPNVMGNITNDQSQLKDDNKSFGGFWVLVDKDNKLASTDFVPTSNQCKTVDQSALWKFNDENEAGLYKAMNGASKDGGAVPMIMVMTSDWEWPLEHKNIEAAYPSWDLWLTQKSTHWYGYNTTTKHYPSNINRELVVKRQAVTDQIDAIKYRDEHGETETEE